VVLYHDVSVESLLTALTSHCTATLASCGSVVAVWFPGLHTEQSGSQPGVLFLW